MTLVGIDPGQRHVGLCLLTGAGPEFFEIKPDAEDILSCVSQITAGLIHQFGTWKVGKETRFSVERQLSVGGQSSSLMFLMQHTVLNVIMSYQENPALVMPLPIQLQSYIKKVHGGDISSARATVTHFQRQLNWKKRISQHCVDAYYLARLAQDVHEGRWEYKLPSSEAKLFPGTILNGKYS